MYRNHLYCLIKEYPDKNWCGCNLLLNPNITIDIYKELKELKQCEFIKDQYNYGLSYNPNITLDIVKENPYIQWDYAGISQLVCLSNLENLNALFIGENIQQEERLLKLNRIAIQQMKLLTDDWRVKKLGIKK